jgi:ATP-dependent DNA helicase RecQ
MASLYPSIIRTLNISPETKVGRIENWDAVKESFWNNTNDTTSAKIKAGAKHSLIPINEFRNYLVENKFTVSSIGVVYDYSRNGLIPSILETWMNEREEYRGLAKKYGKEFVDIISNYVEENDILRPDDLVVKSTGANSLNKLYIIQNIDRKLNLDDIARGKGLNMESLIKEMEQIVYSGTKLNIKYWIDEILDDEQQEEIHEYFMESESDSIEDALKEFDGEYDINELRLMRIKFISEVAN